MVGDVAVQPCAGHQQCLCCNTVMLVLVKDSSGLAHTSIIRVPVLACAVMRPSAYTLCINGAPARLSTTEYLIGSG